jgi:hypothetical protein
VIRGLAVEVWLSTHLLHLRDLALPCLQASARTTILDLQLPPSLAVAASRDPDHGLEETAAPADALLDDVIAAADKVLRSAPVPTGTSSTAGFFARSSAAQVCTCVGLN